MFPSKSSLKGVNAVLYEWIRGDKNDNEGPVRFLNKKSRYIMVIAICLGLLALIWPVTRTGPDSGGKTATDNTASSKGSNKINQDLTGELEYILSRIDGAGKVKVSITLASGGVKTYAANTRNEKREIEESQNGLKKTTSESNVTRDLAVSAGTPLLVEDKTPEVIGVLVVAEGAGSPLIQEKLIQATATLLNVSPHQVCVMPGQDI
jgi:stage III sporulation protein AG